MRVGAIVLIWAVAAVVVALPIIFGSNRWLRIAGVVVLLGMAEFAWMGVQTSARVVAETVQGVTESQVSPFDQGSLATRDVALKFGPAFWATVLGLAVLALVPVRPKG